MGTGHKMAARPTKPSIPARTYVTIAAAAEYTNLHTQTIRRRIADGTIPAYRIGPRMLRVDLAEVHAALRQIPTGGQA